MTLFKKCFALLLLFACAYSQAQFLPDNTALNVQSVQRWMDSNRDFVNVMQVLEPMHQSEEDLKKFEALPGSEQDLQINVFLQKNNLLNIANEIANRHGWKSVGEYMRLSTRLGNAIAAYFFTIELEKLTEEQQKCCLLKLCGHAQGSARQISSCCCVCNAHQCKPELEPSQHGMVLSHGYARSCWLRGHTIEARRQGVMQVPPCP
ncbi:MAG: hypothetical protein EOO68_15485 [Moraxellaceae bacterium]|nr:MAG: hypothetical protein EOO68_15485 [Moraxellaceae bacterium]